MEHQAEGMRIPIGIHNLGRCSFCLGVTVTDPPLLMRWVTYLGIKPMTVSGGQVTVFGG